MLGFSAVSEAPVSDLGTASTFVTNNQTITVTSTSATTLLKQARKILAITSTSVVAILAARTKVLILAVASSSATTMSRSTGKQLAVASTSVVAYAKAIGKVLNVASSSLVTLLTPSAHTLIMVVTEARDSIRAFLFRGKFDYADAEVFDVPPEGRTFRALQTVHTYPDALPFAVPRENTLYSVTYEIRTFKAVASVPKEVIDPAKDIFRANPRLRK
jgi:hypothetical protein